MNNKLSDFIVAGAANCRTMIMVHALKPRPEIYLSKIRKADYFCTDISPDDFRMEYKIMGNQKNGKENRLNLHPRIHPWNSGLTFISNYL